MMLSSNVQRVLESDFCDQCNVNLTSLYNGAISIKFPDEMIAYTSEKTQKNKGFRLCVSCLYTTISMFVKHLNKIDLPLHINYCGFVIMGELIHINLNSNDNFMIIGSGVLNDVTNLNNRVRTLVYNRLKNNL